MRNAQAHVLMRKNQNFSRLGLTNLFVAVHVLVIFLIVARGYIVHPFLVLEIPLHRFFYTLLKLERWLQTDFLLEFARIDGITPIVTLSISNVGYNISSYKNKIKDKA